MRIVFDISAPPITVGGAERSYSDDALACKVGVLVEALAQLNEIWLQDHPRAPLLYDTNIIYDGRDDAEEFLDYGVLLRTLEGDCEDLCAARIAELRQRFGESAIAVISYDAADSDTLYHVTVLRGDGSIEDPSRILGME